MLNDGWDEEMTAGESDAAAFEIYRDSHPCCLECEQPGCIADNCPNSGCDVEVLVTCMGELVHKGCVERFNAHIANKCFVHVGEGCHCQAVPELVDDVEETTPVTPMTNAEIAKVDPLGVFRRLAAVAALVLACVSGVACAHGPAPAVEVESVGQLAAGPSVYSAPLKHDAPPTLGGVADTGDDIETTGPTAADILAGEAANAGTPDGAEKVAHGF